MNDKNKNAIDIYDEIAEDYARNYDSIDDEDDLLFLRAFLSHLIPNSYLIDLGCGTGFSAGWFAKKGFEVEGSDLSSKMIDIAKRNYPFLKFSIADMRTFKSAKSADAVWAGYSMFHFDQDDFVQTIENMKTYLKPHGIFGLVMQEGEGEVEIPEPFLPNKKIYIHLYSVPKLRDILMKHGFEIMDIKRKVAQHPNEFSYNKILLVGKIK